jgi:hypothetical protein
MSEGNVNCGYNQNCKQNNGDLYINFLNYIIQLDECIGFTVWMSNLGSDYVGADMGPEDKYFKVYSEIYPYKNQNYDFSKFN